MLTVCDLSRLNKATVEPEAMHTVGPGGREGREGREEREGREGRGGGGREGNGWGEGKDC